MLKKNGISKSFLNILLLFLIWVQFFIDFEYGFMYYSSVCLTVKNNAFLQGKRGNVYKQNLKKQRN